MNLHGQPSMNGKVEAPSTNSGASVVSTQRTVFPEAVLQESLRTSFYYLSRHTLAGISLWRWLLGGFFLLALLWGLVALPGQWWVSGLLLLCWVIILSLFLRWRRHDFTAFSPLPLPAVPMVALTAADKVGIFTTGHLTVENKAQRFTWLPGFFRTFATREHAIMCYVKQRSWFGLGQWPDQEIGLWYLFFYPHELREVAWGHLTFGRVAQLAIAITYQRTIPKRGRFQPERLINEVVYLGVATEEDGKRILADLFYDQTISITTEVKATSRTNG